MATYSVNMSTLQNIVEEMVNAAQKILAMLSDLNQQVLAKLSLWSSAAREAYNAAQAKWNAAAQAMSQLAQQAAQSLAGINANYSTAESQGLNLWNQ
jgi:6 kDa early secretory antigenic target